MSQQNKTTHCQRQGITLLEILISIGVLSIGLLGVLALLPAASQQAKSGATQDAAAMMGRRAFREMNIRWQGRDEMYVSFGGTPENRIDMDRFYCIDPVGALLIETVPAPGTPTSPAAKLALQTQLAGVASANRVVLGQLAPNGALASVFPPELLDGVFHSKDDLDFGEFASRENPAPNPPQQIALKNNSGVGVKRYATGGLSWFATVVAKNDGYNTVSVAVVNKRSLIANPDGTTADALAEQLLGSSMEGGTGEIEISMAIRPIQGESNYDQKLAVYLAKEEVWSTVKPGHWILLAHVDPDDSSASPSPGNDTAEWYRIQALGSIDSDGNGVDDRRAITVSGNSWNAEIPNTRAIIVPNVIAVYSRSVAR